MSPQQQQQQRFRLPSGLNIPPEYSQSHVCTLPTPSRGANDTPNRLSIFPYPHSLAHVEIRDCGDRQVRGSGARYPINHRLLLPGSCRHQSAL